MPIYKRLVINAFKQVSAFRIDFLVRIVSSFAMVAVQILIWIALYESGGGGQFGVSLEEMVAYVLVQRLVSYFVHSRTIFEAINRDAQNGNISQQLLMPMGFLRYNFALALSNIPTQTALYALPPFAVAALCFGISFSFTPANLVFFIASIALATVITILYSIAIGLSCIWFHNAFFLENLNELVVRLFSGSVVPIWFFPAWLGGISAFLPFRYMQFEPISILLGRTENPFAVLGLQALWVAILFGILQLVWSRGKRKIFTNGG